MPGPDLLVDYDELEHISSTLTDDILDVKKTNSGINYDESSTVTCNESAHNSCVDEYMVREKILERVSDTAADVTKYGITFKDVENSLISSNSYLGIVDLGTVNYTQYDLSVEKLSE